MILNTYRNQHPLGINAADFCREKNILVAGSFTACHCRS